jgi:hypothetical protein
VKADLFDFGEDAGAVGQREQPKEAVEAAKPFLSKGSAAQAGS